MSATMNIRMAGFITFLTPVSLEQQYWIFPKTTRTDWLHMLSMMCQTVTHVS